MSNFRHNGYLIHYNHNHDAKVKILEHIKELKLDSILDGKRMEIRLYTGIPMVHML